MGPDVLAVRAVRPTGRPGVGRPGAGNNRPRLDPNSLESRPEVPMNFGRLALTAVAATVVDMIYGFVVYALLLGSSFNAFPGVYRPADDTSHMGYLALGVFIIMIAATFIFLRGYEGGSAAVEGARFG